MSFGEPVTVSHIGLAQTWIPAPQRDRPTGTRPTVREPAEQYRTPFLQRARAEQKEPGRVEHYRADRPIVELKIAHFTRRPWEVGGHVPEGRFGWLLISIPGPGHQLGPLGRALTAAWGERLGDRRILRGTPPASGIVRPTRMLMPLYSMEESHRD
jgi:hypothetical protein